ncbi:hypothetical protein B0H15DRAFT_817133 [Mycena belliarum]|uniref:Uncharacterized protein n=1 Tax=Mycena belliarum TaxID=1033014 RepID=A0AAD6XST3_9AGAR|nr:hypothetical protein B0H15DRAFT_817133 [Mycena belliae]
MVSIQLNSLTTSFHVQKNMSNCDFTQPAAGTITCAFPTYGGFVGRGIPFGLLYTCRDDLKSPRNLTHCFDCSWVPTGLLFPSSAAQADCHLLPPPPMSSRFRILARRLVHNDLPLGAPRLFFMLMSFVFSIVAGGLCLKIWTKHHNTQKELNASLPPGISAMLEYEGQPNSPPFPGTSSQSVSRRADDLDSALPREPPRHVHHLAHRHRHSARPLRDPSALRPPAHQAPGGRSALERDAPAPGRRASRCHGVLRPRQRVPHLFRLHPHWHTPRRRGPGCGGCGRRGARAPGDRAAVPQGALQCVLPLVSVSVCTRGLRRGTNKQFWSRRSSRGRRCSSRSVRAPQRSPRGTSTGKGAPCRGKGPRRSSRWTRRARARGRRRSLCSHRLFDSPAGWRPGIHKGTVYYVRGVW